MENLGLSASSYVNEKRSSPRIKLRLPVQLKGKTRFGEEVEEQSWTVDINNRGVKLLSCNEWAVGTEVELQVLVVLENVTAMPIPRIKAAGNLLRVNELANGEIGGNEVVIHFSKTPRLYCDGWD